MKAATLSRAALFSDLEHMPHEGQWQVHRSDARFRVVCCGTRWGKTITATYEAIALALEPKPRAVGWIVGPTYDLAEKVWRELVYQFHTRLPSLVVEHRENEKLLRVLNLDGGVCEIRRKSADSPVSLLGEGLDWLVLDEAAQVKGDIWERYLLARLLDKRGRAIIISTPKGKGWFYSAWKRGQARELGYESWRSPTSANPIIAREELELRRKGTPELVWRQEYEAEFLEGAGQVFRNVRDLATGEWQEPIAGQQYVAGLDLAKTVDWTVLVVMNRAREVVHVDRFQRVDWDIQIGRVKAATERYNRCEVLVDSTGKGEPVFEAMVKGGVRARAYPFTHSSKEDLTNNLALMCEKKAIRLPRVELWPEGIDELESFQYSVLPSGTVKTGAPDGEHDDCAVAVMLAAWSLRKDAAPMRVTWV